MTLEFSKNNVSSEIIDPRAPIAEKGLETTGLSGAVLDAYGPTALKQPIGWNDNSGDSAGANEPSNMTRNQRLELQQMTPDERYRYQRLSPDEQWSRDRMNSNEKYDYDRMTPDERWDYDHRR